MDGNVKPNDPPQLKVKFTLTEVLETDEAMKALKVEDPEAHAAVYEKWIKGGTDEQKAKFLRCTRMTLHNRCIRGYNKLLGYLNDQAAGIKLRTSSDI